MKKRKTQKLPRKLGHKGKSAGILSRGYSVLLAELKSRVHAAQLRAALSVNRELILLYWQVGETIVRAQGSKGYGKQVVERLASDLQKEFPGIAGFSSQNIWFMRSFFLAWSAAPEKLSQAV